MSDKIMLKFGRCKAVVLKEGNVKKCIKMGITVLKIVICGGKLSVYDRKLRFTAPLTRRRKTKFPTIKPTIHLHK